MQTYDVIIIGAGVVGNAIARELSKYELQMAVLEKEADVGFGTSSRNSGVLHSGINYKPGTLRAILSVKGNAMMDQLCADLKVKVKRIGKLTVALDEEELPDIKRLMKQGMANGCPDLQFMNNAKMQEIQPGVQGIQGLWSPTTAIISPYSLTIALAENAHANGVDFHLNTKVTAIQKDASGLFIVETENGQKFACKMLVNAAGLYAGIISELAGIVESNEQDTVKIYPCRGEYYVLDKRLDGSLKTLLYPAPSPKHAGLGIHLTPTVDGNILIGPSAQYISEERPEDYASTVAMMADLRKEGEELLQGIQMSDFIRNFSGCRAKRTPPSVGGNADFIIEDSKKLPGFINIVGIESPGLTSAPAIAEMVKGFVANHLTLSEKEEFVAERPGILGHFCDLSLAEQQKLVKEYPEYGEIICRCEKITKKEVRDAIENPLGAKTLIGIKYRARNGMGRCQGGFCMPRVIRLLRDEYGYEIKDYTLSKADKQLFAQAVREGGCKC